MRNRSLIFALAMLCQVGLGRSVHAFDVHLDSDTAFQAYEVRSPRAGAFITRSRLMQNVAFKMVQPLSDDLSEGASVSTVVQLRLEYDFGESCLVGLDLCMAATDASDPGVYQPLLSTSMMDAPTAYAEVSGVVQGLRLRIGRQTLWDALEIRRLDGAHVRMAAASWVALEGYAGAMVRGNSVLGTEAFAMEGRPRRDLDDVDPTLVPYVDTTTTTWMAGTALEMGEPRLIKARLVMQELWESTGTVARQLGVSMSSQPLDILRLSATGGWDLVDGTFFRGNAGANLDLEGWGLDASVERRVPRFDRGSIWAYFETAPIEEARLGGYRQISRALRLSMALRGRQAHLDESTDRDLGVEAGSQMMLGALRVDVNGFAWDGDLGPVSGGLLYAAYPLTSRFSMYGRGSVWYFDDPYQDVLEGVSVSEMVGGRLQITPQSSVVMELSHAANHVAGHRWRALAMLNIEAWR